MPRQINPQPKVQLQMNNHDNDGSTSRLQPDRRRWFEIGFYAMLGAIMVSGLAYVTWRLAGASLDVAAPIVIGMIIAILLDPLVDKLTKRGMSRMLAVTAVFLSFVIVFAGIAAVAVPALINEAILLGQNGPSYIASVQTHIDTFLIAHRKIGGVPMPHNIEALLPQITDRASTFIQTASGSAATFLVGSVVMVLQGVVSLIVSFYLLLDLDRLRARLFFLAPERARGMMHKIGEDVGGVFSDYVRGLLIVCGLYGLFTMLFLYGLAIAHHDLARYALLVGVVAGVLYAVPYVGALATALITFVVAFAAGGLPFAGVAIALLLGLNQIFDNIVTPRVVGGGVGLHPVIAIFALLLGGALFGVWGTVLSVPIAASVQVILYRFFPKLKQPTPKGFLRAQGIRPEEGETASGTPKDEVKTDGVKLDS